MPRTDWLRDARGPPGRPIRTSAGRDADVTRAWTVAELAKPAGLSRSTSFDRCTRTVGITAMKYLLAWRMAVTKDLLRHPDLALTDVAARVAFSRHVGQPASRFRADRSG